MHLSKVLAWALGLRSASAAIRENVDDQAKDPKTSQTHENDHMRRDRPLTHSLADIDHVILLMQGTGCFPTILDSGP